MSEDLHWRRAAIAVILMGIIGVSGYLTTSPSPANSVASGMVLACSAVVATLGLLLGLSRRANRGDHR
jgi:hypothetical protein